MPMLPTLHPWSGDIFWQTLMHSDKKWLMRRVILYSIDKANLKYTILNLQIVISLKNASDLLIFYCYSMY